MKKKIKRIKAKDEEMEEEVIKEQDLLEMKAQVFAHKMETRMICPSFSHILVKKLFCTLIICSLKNSVKQQEHF